MSQEVFVVGTGSSLLTLTEEEIEYINSRPCISVNRYVMFWDIVGIKPKYHIHLDLNEQTNSIIRGALHGSSTLEELNWITTKEHLDLIKRFDSTIESRVKFTLVNKLRGRHAFADKFDSSERLFWCSILGSAINAIHILYPNSTIKILGMDGGPNTHFWAEDLVKNSSKYTDSMYALQKFFRPLKNLINSKRYHNSKKMFEWGLPIILEYFNDKGIGIYNCNQTSDWVVNGQMKYRSVL